jgi:hypothetical protein
MNIRTFDDHIIIEYRDPYYSNNSLYTCKLTAEEINKRKHCTIADFVSILQCSINAKSYTLTYTGNIKVLFKIKTIITEEFLDIDLCCIDTNPKNIKSKIELENSELKKKIHYLQIDLDVAIKRYEELAHHVKVAHSVIKN